METTGQENLDEVGIKPAINELLQVQLQDDPNPSTYRSRIENIVEEKLVATWPTAGGIRLPLHADQMLNFSLVRDGNPYAFTGLVDSTASDPLPQITVILNSELHKVQRRQNYRIKSLVPTELLGEIPVELMGSVSSASGKHGPIPIFIRTTTYNISAGGIAIRNPKGVPEGTLLEAKIGLPDKEPTIKVPCRVVYNEPSVDNPELHQIGIQFLAISEKERARIVRYIYRTQLKGLRD
jgi:c-di-GMP-binding flagellar brake protein YcgR